MNKKIAYIFALVDTIINGTLTLGIALSWKLPMLKKVKKAKEGNAVLTFHFCICALIFLNPVAGILLLVDHEQ